MGPHQNVDCESRTATQGATQQSVDCESLTPTRGATQQSMDCESLTPTRGATQQSVDYESLTPSQGARQQSVDCESLTPTQGATTKLGKDKQARKKQRSALARERIWRCTRAGVLLRQQDLHCATNNICIAARLADLHWKHLATNDICIAPRLAISGAQKL